MKVKKFFNDLVKAKESPDVISLLEPFKVRSEESSKKGIEKRV